MGEFGPVLVTGAASGIGRAAALRFASSGAPVGCVDTDGPGLRDVCAEIERRGGRALPLEADVSVAADVRRVVATFANAAGGIGTVVSNAGVVVRKDLRATSEEEWDRTMAVNVRGAFLLAQATMPHLAEARGSFLAVTSVVAHIGFGLPAYTASKGALVALVQELAGEVAHLGVRVNAVSPATVAGTAVTRDSLANPAVLARTCGAIPLGRVATVDDVVDALEFLASSRASFVTGHVLRVDGGMSTSLYALQAPRPPG